MRDLVEAASDVSLHDPLIRAGSEVVHLGYRVMSPALRTEPVTTRKKVRLEDRLQHQQRPGRRRVGIHQRLSQHSNLRTANLLAPFAMYTPLACSDYYRASVPPHGHQSTTDLPMTGPDAQPEGRPRAVPAFTITRS